MSSQTRRAVVSPTPPRLAGFRAVASVGVLVVGLLGAGVSTSAQTLPWELPNWSDSTRAAATTLPLDFAVVASIAIEGNRKTRRDIVLRAMDLGVGDTLRAGDVAAQLARQRRLLLNTGLFSEAELLLRDVDPSRRTVRLRILVREKWYVYPGLDIDLADRNFNVWWTEQGAGLDRVNAGVNVKHYNTTGRQDRTTLILQGGYTRKVELTYRIPYIDRRQLVGVELGVLTNSSREWGAFTEGGIMRFVGSDTANVLERNRLRGAVSFSPGLFARHELRVERQRNTASGLLAGDANPRFFGGARVEQRFWGLRYSFRVDRRDVRPFPQAGYLLEARAEKLGLGGEDLNRLVTSLALTIYRPLPFGKLNVATAAKVSTDLVRTPQPYFNRVSLGFDDDFVRGYQLYVADGLDFAYAKTTLRRELFDLRVRLPFAPVRRLQLIPLRVDLALLGDLGYMRDPFGTPGNLLANRLLTSYGVGAYANLFFGKVFRFELARNGFGEWGGYVGYSLGF